MSSGNRMTAAELRSLSEDEKIRRILELQARLDEVEPGSHQETTQAPAELELLHTVFDHLPVMFAAIDEDWRILFWNRECERVMGYSKSEVFSDQDIRLKMYPDPEYRRHLRENREALGKEFREFEARVMCKDGQERIIFWFVQGQTYPIPGWHSWIVGLDITARREAEKALAVNERRYRTLVDAFPDGLVALFGHDYRYIVAGGALLNALGINPDDMVGKLPGDLLLTVNTDLVHPAQDRVLRGESITQEVEFGRATYMARSVPVLDDAGHVQAGMVMLQDITRYKEIQEALLVSERRYRALFQNSNDAVFINDMKLNIVDANQQACDLVGYSLDEMKVMGALSLIIVDHHPEASDHVQRLLRGEKIPIYERILRHKDGSLIPVEASLTLIRDEEHTPIQFQIICRDITQRKAIDARLRANETWFRAIFESGVLGVMIVDPAGAVIEMNTLLMNLLAYQQADLSTLSLYEMFVAGDRHELKTRVASLAIDNAYSHAELRLKPKGSRSGIWFDAILTGVFDEEGQLQSVLIVGKDISAEREAEQHALEMAIERQKVNLISDFIEVASHEFRTPLAGISTNLYLLRRMIENSNAEKYLHRIETEAGVILRLVEALLLVVKLNSDDALHLEPVDAHALIEIVVSKLHTQYGMQALRLVHDFDEQIPRCIMDAHLMEEALSQIIDNAMRYSQKGGKILVRTQLQLDQLHIRIKDSGIGIHADHLPHIFSQFFRIDAVRTTRGLGLGLPIAQKIVQRHQGRLEISSQLGEGTSVDIWLPINPQPSPVQTTG